nr:MAG TPA: hypothetical protein [Caudoviricetes sp.]
MIKRMTNINQYFCSTFPFKVLPILPCIDYTLTR